MMWLSKNIKVLGSFFHQKWEVFVCSMWWSYSVFGFTGNQFCYNSKHEWHSHHTHRCTYFLLKQTENRGHKFYRAQKNLEKPGKPGKTDFFEKSQGNSGKLRKFSFLKKIRENSGKFFYGELFLQNSLNFIIVWHWKSWTFLGNLITNYIIGLSTDFFCCFGFKPFWFLVVSDNY